MTLPRVRVAYYVDTVSSWCFIAEAAIDRLREEFGDRITFEWKIIHLKEGAPIEGSPEKFAWFYGRTKAVTGVQLNPAWHTSAEDTSVFPNLAAEAARSLGVTDDRVRRALTREGLLEGKRIPTRQVAVDIAARAGNLDAAELSKAMDDHNTWAKIIAATIELRRLPITVIPAFVISNDVGDRAILSGFYTYETIGSVVREAMQASERYAEFMAREPEPRV